MGGIKKDYSGIKVGQLKIIGDTGKVNNQNQQIVIARHNSGKIVEGRATSILSGDITGNPRNGGNPKMGEIYEKYRSKAQTNFKKKIIETPAKNNTSGVSGVSFKNRDKVWEATIGYQGKRMIEEARQNSALIGAIIGGL